MMLDSTFGHKDSVQVVEWLNMNHVNESSVVLAMPVKDGSLTLQASPAHEVQTLNPRPKTMDPTIVGPLMLQARSPNEMLE
jgi:hypothetical protein